MTDEKKECSGGEEISITSFSKKEFSRLFFESIDEMTQEECIRTGGQYPDWDRAVARAKLEGVVPLMGAGPRVMATISHRGVTIEACYGDCLFRIQACECNGLDKDMCFHPAAPQTLVLKEEKEPPRDCPLREATFYVVLDESYDEKDE